VKAILFDFGGTIDTNGVHWSEMFWGYYGRNHLRVGKAEFGKAFTASDEMLAAEPDIARLDFRTMLQRQFRFQFELLGLSGAGTLAATAADQCHADVLAIAARARTLLEAFGAAYRLGLVSNFYGNLEQVCGDLSIAELFEVKVDSAVEGVRKPDPAIFSLALERLGLPGEQAYVVGDSYERDIVPAKLLGCRTIWLKGRSWTAPPKDTGAADYSITSLEAMKAIVLP